VRCRSRRSARAAAARRRRAPPPRAAAARRRRAPPPPRARARALTISHLPLSSPPAEGKAPSVKYEGEYVEGRKKGLGRLSLPNGDRYHGEFVADAFEGEGSYFYANGDIYSGAWKAGVQVGAGTFLFARDESQLVGTWAKGAMVTGKWVWKDGTSWHGPFKKSQPLGRGVFYFPNGLAQQGEFVVEGEGDADDPDAQLKTTWKGGAVRTANAPSSELTRAN
jgi:hypothetical protein